MTIGTGDRAPDFDLEVTWKTRVRLADVLERANVLLVFHPFAFTDICDDEALDLQQNLDEFRHAQTEVVLVACEPSATRQAWRAKLGLEFTVASDFWPHGAAARAYGVFNEANGAAHRGTFLIDRSGIVIWSLVHDIDTRRVDQVKRSLDTLPNG